MIIGAKTEKYARIKYIVYLCVTATYHLHLVSERIEQAGSLGALPVFVSDEGFCE